MKVSVPPFRTPEPGRFDEVIWYRLTTDGLVELEEYLADWDPSTRLHLAARVRMDGVGVREDTGLPAGAPLHVALAWRSRSTSIAGGVTGPAISDEEIDVTLELVLEGHEVGGIVDLEAILVLAEACDAGRHSAKRPGSVLWRDTAKVSLEGDMSRFPVTNADFGQMPGRDVRSSWYLDWDPKDLQVPLLTGVRLFVNDAHPVVAQAVTTDTELEGARFIRDALKLDVARTLIAGALTNPEFDYETEFEPDMVGAVLQRLLRNVFPRRTLNELRLQQSSTPGEIEAAIQAFLGSFDVGGAG